MKLSKLIAAIIALSAAVSFSGCSVKFGVSNDINAGISSIAGLSLDAVLAKPGADKYKDDKSLAITYETFRKEYLFWLKGQGITDDTAEANEKSCTERRSQIINYLINELILRDKAEELGVALSEEEIAEVQQEFDEYVAEQVKYFGDNADYATLESSETVSDQLKEERGNELFDEYLTECGVTRDDLLLWQTYAALNEKMRGEVCKDAAVERSEAQERYNEFIDSIKAEYKEDPDSYDYNSYYHFWVPEGTRMAKHILIKLDEQTADEISFRRQTDDEAGADELREEALAEIEYKITEIKELLDDGADFDELMEEYSDDEDGAASYPDGYCVTPNSGTYVPGFKEALFSLEEKGDYTVVGTDLGWHIVLYAADAEVTDEQTEEYIDIIYNELSNNAAQTVFDKTMKQWNEEYDYTIDHAALKIEPADSTQEAQTSN